MHQSRLAGFIIDCDSAALDGPVAFWGAALGMDARPPDGAAYVPLDAAARDLVIEVQRVSHPSRVHLDIETDDVEAEVGRLEALGARRLEQIRSWWVMEAPTGHRFCVVRARASLEGRAGTRRWP
jgi:hypothetical protein